MTSSPAVAESPSPSRGTGGPGAAPVRWWRTRAAAVAGCLASFAAFLLAQRAAGVTLLDLDVYRAEGWTVRTGGDLYAMRATKHELPATYPPFAALLFIPLTWPSVDAMRVAATLANLALLVALVHLSLRLTGRASPRATCAVAALAVWCEPVWTTLRYGQINLLIAVLVLWDLTRRPGHRWAGAGTGIAAGIKLTPALFVVCLAVAGAVLGARRLRHGVPAGNVHLRRAAVATGAFAGTVALAAAAVPRDSLRFWTEVIFDSGDRAGEAESAANQNVRGVVARALSTGEPPSWWLLVAAAAVCVGLATAVAALLAGERLPHGPAWAAVTCGVTALLVSPFSWSHHWVWAVPLVLLLAVEAERRHHAGWTAGAVAAGLLFCSFALWAVPHDAGRPELDQSLGEMALCALYPAAGAAFLATAATVTARAWRRPCRPRRPGSPRAAA
ncbi:glycosyltransferase 87 family protein [Streptomyces sp. SBT349]|uniref:glycosyltransferase 87 family protein n=1 Tax=Streptomyces sp. SBT349 TaxID=1580539 RepID=UPI00066D08DF|nr:glycosyltransferase 87 family protein [Streptomyces sp. SBT349]